METLCKCNCCVRSEGFSHFFFVLSILYRPLGEYGTHNLARMKIFLNADWNDCKNSDLSSDVYTKVGDRINMTGTKQTARVKDEMICFAFTESKMEFMT